MTGRDFLIPLLLVFLLIFINAFFVTAEFSIVSVRRSRISQLAKAGDIQAQTVQSLQRSLDRLLSTTQLGITLSSLAIGWIGEQTMAAFIAQTIAALPLPQFITKAIAHSFAIPIAFLVLAYLQIVLGELCPKSVALIYSEQLARFFGPPSLVIARIFLPFIWILNQSTRCLLRSAGIEYTGQGWYKQVTSEELQLIIATERESTGLEAEERELLNNVFEFGDVLAVEVMTPRIRIDYLSIDATFSDLLQQVATNQHSRYPVIGDSLDDIQGIIDYKDLALPLTEGKVNPQTSIKPWVKPVRFVTESTPLNELLSMMQRSQLQMVIIVDEFGGTSGLITFQDLIAEIIGAEREVTEAKEDSVQMLDESSFLVPAPMNLEEVNQLLGLDLPIGKDYYTLAGFLLDQWQKIPTQGETLHYQNLDFTVTVAEDNRLYQVLIHRREPSFVEEVLDDSDRERENDNVPSSIIKSDRAS
ncbi:MAG: hemolysin family protein [Xenococcaceae cyanobacterium MO_188.B32]|nr:hemolysin family protein [Xenococcaceae cyanobacterium MO_188.B32]